MDFGTTAVGSTAVSAFSGEGNATYRDSVRLWHAVLGRLQFEVSAANFDTWLKPTTPLSNDSGVLVVQAASSFAANHLNEGLGVVVSRVVENLVGPGLRVRFVPAPAPAGRDQGAALAGAVPVAGVVNPGYRFENFYSGAGNQLALSACKTIVSNGPGFSPVTVWGESAMGKSHLLHATAAAASGRGWRVACHSAEEFTTLYMSALRRESMEDFQRAERGVRLLVIDDIQYLTGKRGITDELTHTIDAVANTGGMVLCSSEEHPSVLSLGERLKSRLLAGVAAQVSCLEQDERIAFIEALATDLRSPIPGWAIARLANVQVCTMRTLRGMVCAAVGLQKARLLDEGRLDAEIILVAAAPGGQPRLTDRELLDAVAEQFGVTLDELAGRSRGGGVRDARAIAVAALKRRGRSLSQIGAVVGGRDRSTIAGLAERGKVLLEDFPALSERLAV